MDLRNTCHQNCLFHTTQDQMQPQHSNKRPDPQMLVSSPRCSLNCQGLSIHLPPLGERRDCVGTSYLSQPMSTSFTHPSTDEHSHRHYSNGRPASSTPPSQTPTSGKRSPNHARTFPTNKALARDARGDRSTPCCIDHESSTISMRPKSEASRLSGDWNEEQSSNHQESPEAQLVPGPPGIARRAKAHVPSACVNCKKKHLACETKRPCNRCVQTGKEVSGLKFIKLSLSGC